MIMQISPKFHPPPERFAVLLFDGFSNHCLANTIEPLRAANNLSGRPLYNWRVLSPDGDAVTSSSNLTLTPDGPIHAETGDTLFVMPSYNYQEHSNRHCHGILQRCAGRYRMIAGLDTGSWLMAEAGLLDGRRATIHWDELTRFAERFPEIDVSRARYVIDGPRITCSGATAAFDLVLDLIARRHGHILAVTVAQLFMTGTSDDASPTRLVGPSINRALAIMQDSLEAPLPITEIARRIGKSQRWLEQRMRAELQQSPRDVYVHLRMTLARKLVAETDLSVSEIAVRCGYADTSAFTRAFRGAFQMAPRDLRNRHLDPA
ncbi:MAG: GlxA family transcriptional regulator [Pseudomonadota bacterium]